MSIHVGGRGPGHVDRRLGVSIAAPITALNLGLNMEIFDWWGFCQPEVSIAAGDAMTDDVSVKIPAANRDSSGTPNSIPAGKNAIILRMMTPGQAIPYKLTWTDNGGANAISAVYTTQFMTSVTQNLGATPPNIIFTPTVIQSNESNSPALGYQLAGGKYPSNFICRPVTDPGGVLDANFAANTTAVMGGGLVRFVKPSTIELNNSPIAPAGTGATISSITFVGTTATLTTSTAHGLSSPTSQSASVTVTGATPATYNVTNAYITVTSPTTFTYTMGGTPTGNATVMGSYTYGDVNSQLWNLHYPVAGSEPGTQLNDPVYTSANRNKNINEIGWRDGIPIERMVTIGTAMTGGGVWYNLPWNADSTFYTDAANKWVAYAQATGRKVAIELANEVWNPGYAVQHQCVNEANYRGTQAGSKTQCKLIATSNITLSGTQTIDGFSAGVGDVVLCVGQTTAAQNGSYTVASGAWTRADASIVSLDVWYVTSGLTNAQTSWVVTTTGAITVGTTSLTIARFTNFMRYAEKAMQAFSYFESAFATAGISSQLIRVLCWQNAASPNVWDNILTYGAMTSHCDMIATACYYDAIGLNGITAGYTGTLPAVVTAMNTSIDNVIGLAVGHQAKATSYGKLFGQYEAGYGSVFTDLTFRQTYNRSSSAYDVQLRFAQQLELRLTNAYVNIFAYCYPINSGSNNAWGLLETGYSTPDKANSPKYKALADFNGNIRVLSAATGTIASAAQDNTVGTLLGTVIKSVYGCALSLTNSDSGNVAIDSLGNITVAQSLGSASLGTHSFTVRQTDSRDATGFFDTVFNYQVTPALPKSNFNNGTTFDSIWMDTDKKQASGYSFAHFTVAQGSGVASLTSDGTGNSTGGKMLNADVDTTLLTKHYITYVSVSGTCGASGFAYGTSTNYMLLNAQNGRLELYNGAGGYDFIGNFTLPSAPYRIRFRFPDSSTVCVDLDAAMPNNPPLEADWVQKISVARPVAHTMGVGPAVTIPTSGRFGFQHQNDSGGAGSSSFDGFNMAS